jgi:hypothetical protein
VEGRTQPKLVVGTQLRGVFGKALGKRTAYQSQTVLRQAKGIHLAVNQTASLIDNEQLAEEHGAW